ncbi:337_t:CDS:1, partial [Ambispora leptoticha]
IAGRIIDDEQSNLTPETAEILVCGQDWLRNEKEQGWKKLRNDMQYD